MTFQPETALLWLKKARNDMKAGKDEFNTDEPATDTICFHMQQTAEKYLKAYLIFHGHEAEKTHDISRILDTCRAIDGEFSELADAGIDVLSPYGRVVDYPDDFYLPSINETSHAIMLADKIKNFVEHKLEELGMDVYGRG